MSDAWLKKLQKKIQVDLNIYVEGDVLYNIVNLFRFDLQVWKLLGLLFIKKNELKKTSIHHSGKDISLKSNFFWFFFLPTNNLNSDILKCLFTNLIKLIFFYYFFRYVIKSYLNSCLFILYPFQINIFFFDDRFIRFDHKPEELVRGILGNHSFV